MNEEKKGDIQLDVLPSDPLLSSGMISSSTKDQMDHRNHTTTNIPTDDTSVKLVWQDLKYGVKIRKLKFDHNPWPKVRIEKSKKQILSKQSGVIETGSLTAVIGPSGAGKSSLLKCLAGVKREGVKGSISVCRETIISDGNIRINHSNEISQENERSEKSEKSSRKDSTEMASLKKIKVIYIGQEDDMIKVLTVRESLMYASCLKNYHISSEDGHEKIVNKVIQDLGLETCADTMVAKCSGGQIKRLSFALELLSKPEIMILDEPTSGLDSSSASQCVQVLRQLTKRHDYHDHQTNLVLNHDVNRKSQQMSQSSLETSNILQDNIPLGIIASIHQPSATVLYYFHRLYILSKNGECLYQGPTQSLVSYLTSFGLRCPQFHNPADFVIEIASGDFGSDPIKSLADANQKNNQSCHKSHNYDNHITASTSSMVDTSISHPQHVNLNNQSTVVVIQTSTGNNLKDQMIEKNDRSNSSQEEDEDIFKTPPSKIESPDGDENPTTSNKSLIDKHDTSSTSSLTKIPITSVVDSMVNQSFPKMRHLNLLVKRTWIGTYRDPLLTWLRLIQHVLIALIGSLSYNYKIGEADGCFTELVKNVNSKNVTSLSSLSSEAEASFLKQQRIAQDNATFIFFSLLFLAFANTMPTVLTYPLEMVVFIKERRNSWYGSGPYYLAKLFADTPFQVVIPLIFCIIAWPLTGQIEEFWRFFFFCLICITVASISQAIGILFGILFLENVNAAVFMAPVSLTPFFLMGGLFVPYAGSSLIMKPIAMLSYIRYSFETLLLVIYGFDRCDAEGNFINSKETKIMTRMVCFLATKDQSLGLDVSNDTSVETSSDEMSSQISYWISSFKSMGVSSDHSHFISQVLGLTESCVKDVLYKVEEWIKPSTSTSATNANVTAESVSAPNSYMITNWDLNESNLWQNIAILFFILVVLRIVAFFLLVLKTNQKLKEC